jgi:hypothetical protein
MIDAQELKKGHETAGRELDSLQGDENDVLQHYCSLITDEYLKVVANGRAQIDVVIINAIRSGVALGMAISIKNGEVLAR